VDVAACAAWCRWSGTALALAVDHRNDVLAAVAAVAAVLAAVRHPSVWWLDPAGALAIAAYVVVSWLVILRQQVRWRVVPWLYTEGCCTIPYVVCRRTPLTLTQVLHVVGVVAEAELVDRIRQLAMAHHRDVTLDALRVYHSGRHGAPPAHPAEDERHGSVV
jgi:hypothetical protein